MTLLRVLLARVLGLFGRHRREAELHDEIQTHLDRLTEDYLGRGLSTHDARAAARREFGGVDQVKETYRDQRGLPLVEGFARDTRIAFRTSRSSPAFAGIVIGTLALGIAATVAMFAVLDHVVLRPLPYPSADRLVRVQSPVPGVRSDAIWNLSTAEYFYFRDHVHAFEAMGLYVSTSGTLGIVSDVPGSTAERITTGIVSSDMLGLLGAHPLLGRLFTPNDERYDLRTTSPPVVVLSYEVWQRRLGGRPDIIGRTVVFEDHPYPVVGVLGPGVELPETVFSPHAKVGLWMPLGLDANAPAINQHMYRAMARLRPGSSLVEAQHQLDLLTPNLPQLFPSAYSSAFMTDTRFSTAVVPLHDDVLGSARQMLWVLAGAIGVVFFIAVANIANLFLVRTETRRREVSIRLAFGATHADLFRHALAESVSLCVASAIVGIGLASVALRAVVDRAHTSVPRLSGVHLDARSLIAAGFATLVLATGFAAFSVMRPDVDAEGALRQQVRTTSRRQQRIRRVLVAAQVALALVLVTAAALMASSVQHLLQVRPGFDAGHVLTFDLMLPRARYPSEPRVAAYHRELAAALMGNPNIDVVGAATSTPLDGQDGCDAIWVEGHAFVSGGNPCVDTTQVAPGYFEALRIAIRGRVLDSDTAHGEVVVSESLARRLWPGEDAIGKGLRINGDGPPYYGVVGVAADVRRNGFDKPAAETVYLPIVSRAGAPREMRVVIRTRIANAAAVMPDVRSIVGRVDSNVPIANVQTLADAASESMARSSFTTTLLAMAALLAMVLSAVGLYGVIAYGVASRRAELGIRLALGARPVGLRLMVFRETLLLVLAGIGMGMVAALGSTRFIAGFLYGVSPHDPATLASVTTVLLCVGLLAGVIPAWRASRVDPLVALRRD